MGGLLGLALVLLVVRAEDEQASAELSAVAQSLGYLLAAAGPVRIGWLRT